MVIILKWRWTRTLKICATNFPKQLLPKSKIAVCQRPFARIRHPCATAAFVPAFVPLFVLILG
jgi:hypothetical protein